MYFYQNRERNNPILSISGNPWYSNLIHGLVKMTNQNGYPDLEYQSTYIKVLNLSVYRQLGGWSDILRIFYGLSVRILVRNKVFWSRSEDKSKI